MRNLIIGSLALALVCSSCSDDSNPSTTSNNQTNNGSNNQSNNGSDAGMDASDLPALTPDRECDSLVESYCSLPWPSNAFLVPDSERVTGQTLVFGEATLPPNKQGVHIAPAPYSRRDGYGLSAPAIALFPNVDASRMPTEYSVEKSMEDDAEVLLFEVTDAGLTRIPNFVDHDQQTADPTKRALIVRPGQILKPATRYIAVFRNLVDTDGAAIPRSAAFEALVSGNTGADANLYYRQARFDEVFDLLTTAGVTKESLTLAWDWNTASEEALHHQMISMRDQALALMPDGPELTVTEVTEFTEAENANIAIRLKGTFDVPNFIEVNGNDKYVRVDADGNPLAEGTRTADFWINIPRSALDGTPQGLVMYGHGLFGLGSQVNSGHNAKIGNDHDYIFYGGTLWGMGEVQGEADAVQAVFDLSLFRTLGDQLQQGMMEWVLLARAMEKRFPTLSDVTTRGVTVDTDKHFYSGISQGGIFGPTFVALSPDVQFGHAGVPGHTYAFLLHRSVDFTPFFTIIRNTYPDVVDQLIALHTIQLLWDSTDPVSYFWNLSARPIDGSDGNSMMWTPAKGDFQVSVVQNETLARTPGLGVSVMENYDSERSVALATPATYPHQGSAVVLYDFEKSPDGYTFRNQWPAPGNLAPTNFPNMTCATECPADRDVDGTAYSCCSGSCCFDPHSLPRREDNHNEQMIHFFESGGEVIDVCGGDVCSPL
jgi:hypothetical protein